MEGKADALWNKDKGIDPRTQTRTKIKRILLTDVLPLGILIVVVIGLLLIGGALFHKLEKDEEDMVIYSFGAGVEYSMTLITTIGYGAITPTTQGGRLATVFYGTIAIPFFFTTMFKIGSILSNLIAGLFGLFGMKSKVVQATPDGIDDSSPKNLLVMMLGIFLFLLYLVGTTFWIRDYFASHYEEYGELSFIDALYFNFVTLSTTGFGDIYFHDGMSGGIYVYLIAGLALLFMNIVMVKAFVDQIFRVLQRELGVL